MSETPDNDTQDTLEALEIRLLLDGIFQHYGYDFSNYAPGSLNRRIEEGVRREGVASVSGLLEKVLHDPDCMHRLIDALTIAVSDMFRDPGFFLALRNEVVPLLRTYPFIRVWHAGCGRGEEVYSMAILLEEEGLHNRCRIYATDLNEKVIRQAQSGIFPLDDMQEYTRNYLAAGGKRDFSEYYTAKYGNAMFRPRLKENIVFSRHNLVTDGPFNEFNIILCRNVMIYFNRSLQARAHNLFHDSLVTFGFLGLGRQETIKFTPHETSYEAVNEREKIYKKTR